MISFYMVKGEGPTSVLHDSYDAAVSEAKRLARANPSHHFFVLKAVSGFIKDDVREIDLEDELLIPF